MLRNYLVAYVDLHGLTPKRIDCDMIRAKSPENAAMQIHLSTNDDSFEQKQIVAVARSTRGTLEWQYFESIATVRYEAKAIDAAKAEKLASETCCGV